MKLPPLPYTSVDWHALPATEHKGETGTATWRTLNNGDVRMRIVELSPGYLADHWCDRGHIVYVLEGEVTSELKDGRSFVMTPGTGLRAPLLDDIRRHDVHHRLTNLRARSRPFVY
jgi:uncharacterized cupin superfamily protein